MTPAIAYDAYKAADAHLQADDIDSHLSALDAMTHDDLLQAAKGAIEADDLEAAVWLLEIIASERSDGS